MLNKLEASYLGILRVVILVAATIALVTSVLSIASVVAPAGKALGLSSDQMHGGTLDEYISEKRAMVPPSSESLTDGNPQATTSAAPTGQLEEAAQNFEKYNNGRADRRLDHWRSRLATSAESLPVEYRDRFAKSIKRLSQQLRISKGKALSPDQIDELIDWHTARFTNAAAAEQATAAAEAARVFFSLYVAGAAFFFFLLIVFVFLFVRVERSLRLVRVVHTETADA